MRDFARKILTELLLLKSRRLLAPLLVMVLFWITPTLMVSIVFWGMSSMYLELNFCPRKIENQWTFCRQEVLRMQTVLPQLFQVLPKLAKK